PSIAHWKYEIRRVVSENAGSPPGQSGRTQCRRAVPLRKVTALRVGNLRRIDLGFEGDDLVPLCVCQSILRLQMSAGRRARLTSQTRLTCIRHHVHLHKLSSFRVSFGWLSILGDEPADAEAVSDHVLQIGCRTWTTVNGYRRRRTVQSIHWTGI